MHDGNVLILPQSPKLWKVYGLYFISPLEGTVGLLRLFLLVVIFVFKT